MIYVDDLTKHSDQLSTLSKVGAIAHKRISVPYSVPVPSTPYKTAFATPSFSPAKVASPAKGEKSAIINGSNIPQLGLGVKKVLTDYLSIDKKGKDYRSPNEKSVSKLTTFEEVPASGMDLESSECTEEAISPKISDQAWEE